MFELTSKEMRIAFGSSTDYGERDERFYKLWIQSLDLHGVKHKFVDLTNPGWLEGLSGCDGVIWRPGHSPYHRLWGFRILYTIAQYLELPIYPSIGDYWHYDEKISQTYLLQAAGFPTPTTWIFSDMQPALEWTATANYPIIFKLTSGAGSFDVIKISSQADAERLVERMFTTGVFQGRLNYSEGSLIRRIARGIRNELRPKGPKPGREHWHQYGPQAGYVLFQEFIPHNDYDTRVTIIGNRAFGFRRWNRDNDFRASGSGKIDHSPELIDPKCIELAFEASQKLGLNCMAYDLIFRNGEPVILEISYTFLDTAVHSCPGHWLPDLSWVEGHTWPEEAQVEDFLQRVDSHRSVSQDWSL